MKSIEKNDIDISKLFSWGSSLTLKNKHGDDVLTVYMRIIGDADVNRARVIALRKSAELREKLKTPGSDERVALLPSMKEIEKEKIIETMLFMTLKDLSSVAEKNLVLKYPQEPDSDATLEEQEEYQKQVDDWPNTLQTKISESLEKEVAIERKRLQQLSENKLKTEYEDLWINRLCEVEMYNSFQDICVVFGSYKDADYKRKLFNSIDDFQNLPTEVKEQLLDFYATLIIDIDELKK